jgi:hypothetical protein
MHVFLQSPIYKMSKIIFSGIEDLAPVRLATDGKNRESKIQNLK